MYRNQLSGMLLLLVLPMLLIRGPGNSARAEIADMSHEQLHRSASNVVPAEIVNIYHSTRIISANLEHTNSVAELSIIEVKKGSGIAVAERLYVRFWRKRWIGQGQAVPDHYGHRGVPEKGNRALIYLQGSRSAGWDVLSPNGFAEQDEILNVAPRP